MIEISFSVCHSWYFWCHCCDHIENGFLNESEKSFPFTVFVVGFLRNAIVIILHLH